ncbi:MAG: TonB-dependent receptor [Lentimicrobiaceae bacterium]|nr:TonB-dependent receptor [Lentimicrobiaceae bacterium]
MRITTLLLLISLMQTYATNSYSQNTRLSLKMENASLENILSEIEKVSEFRFFYRSNEIDPNVKHNVDANQQTVDEVLNSLLKDSNLTFKVFDKYIAIVSKENANENVASLFQQKPVSGKVTDQFGATLPGVSVVVKGTTVGVITDNNGNFSISNIPDNAILQFSFVGMKPQEIAVAGKSTINVVLTEETVGIEEVVAIGYGTQRKVVATGSIVSTKGAELVKIPAQNLANSLTGRLPGVIINTRSGEPGYDDPTIFIRGLSTTGNANPLIIIDGVERSGIGRLNPNDIENVTVLKDATAAIYGARAANGVILVTTKRGTDGKSQFEVNFNQGFTQPTRTQKMADSYLFANVQNEYRAAQGLSAKYTDAELQKFRDGTDPDNYPNTNWQDLMIKTLTPTQRADISVSGGSKKMKYFVSLGGLNQPGQFNYGTETYKQYNFRSNIDVQVTDYFKFGFDLSGRMEDRHRPVNDPFSHIMLYLPMWQLHWPGTDYLYPCRDGQNIINMVSDAAGYRNQNYRGVTSTLSFKLDLPWVKGLWVDGSANYDAGYNFNKTWNTPSYVYNKNSFTGIYTKTTIGSAKASLSENFDQSTFMTVNAKINFKRSFKKHNLDAMAGYEQRQTNYDYLSAFRNNFISTELPQLFAGSSVASDQGNSGTASTTARQNYFGRASYDYAGKYLAQAIFRYDGSMNFAKDKRWGLFPGFSLGWRLSEESFMKGVTFINNLKIRASYGEMGNDQVSSYQYLMSYGYNTNYSNVIGNNDVSGLTQSGVPNPDITWEVAKTSNLGLEATLWDNLLGVEFDVFKTRRSNILTTRNAVVPDYTGLALPSQNVGIVENKGFELQLSHINNKHAIKYSLTGNFSFARNKVIYADEVPAAEPYQLATGRPIGSALYYNAIGIFRDQAQINSTPHLVGATPGDIIFQDANNDGVINSRDQIRINETNVPQIVYGFTTSFSYKGFDLSALFQGQANAIFYSNWFGRFNSDVGNFFTARAEGRWTPQNIEGTMPRNDYGGNSNLVQSTQWLKDAGFLRLKNLELGYNLPKRITEKLKVQGFRIFVNGFNLFYLYDHLKDWGQDPEANNTTFYYSQQRVLNMGFNLTF